MVISATPSDSRQPTDSPRSAAARTIVKGKPSLSFGVTRDAGAIRSSVAWEQSSYGVIHAGFCLCERGRAKFARADFQKSNASILFLVNFKGSPRITSEPFTLTFPSRPARNDTVPGTSERWIRCQPVYTVR